MEAGREKIKMNSGDFFSSFPGQHFVSFQEILDLFGHAYESRAL